MVESYVTEWLLSEQIEVAVAVDIHEAIPLAELGRPRIDVVLTVSGIFRDLFSPTVQLLDKAVRLVAHLDEPPELNYVRKHVLQQVEHDACEPDDAAVRVFSNAPGNYGTNVNFMVMDSQWEQDETLGDLFVTRKCFAYGRDSRGRAIEGREARLAMDRVAHWVDQGAQPSDAVRKLIKRGKAQAAGQPAAAAK